MHQNWMYRFHTQIRRLMQGVLVLISGGSQHRWCRWRRVWGWISTWRLRGGLLVDFINFFLTPTLFGLLQALTWVDHRILMSDLVVYSSASNNYNLTLYSLYYKKAVVYCPGGSTLINHHQFFLFVPRLHQRIISWRHEFQTSKTLGNLWTRIWSVSMSTVLAWGRIWQMLCKQLPQFLGCKLVR